MVAFTVPNVLDDFNRSYAAGRERSRDRGVSNALAMAGSDPTGAQNALMRYGAVNEASAIGQMQRQQRQDQGRTRAAQLYAAGDRKGANAAALESGNEQLVAAFKGMRDEELQEYDRLAQMTGGIAYYLITEADPAQRTQLGTAAVQALVQQGRISQEQGQNIIAKGFDDATLNGHVMDGLGLKGMIDNERAEREAQKPPSAPSGYQWGEDGRLAFIPGGPADPAQVGQIASTLRDAVVSRPMPTRAASGRAAPAPKPPAGFILD